MQQVCDHPIFTAARLFSDRRWKHGDRALPFGVDRRVDGAGKAGVCLNSRGAVTFVMYPKPDSACNVKETAIPEVL
jgi:hypothetical protein